MKRQVEGDSRDFHHQTCPPPRLPPRPATPWCVCYPDPRARRGGPLPAADRAGCEPGYPPRPRRPAGSVPAVRPDPYFPRFLPSRRRVHHPSCLPPTVGRHPACTASSMARGAGAAEGGARVAGTRTRPWGSPWQHASLWASKRRLLQPPSCTASGGPDCARCLSQSNQPPLPVATGALSRQPLTDRCHESSADCWRR